MISPRLPVIQIEQAGMLESAPQQRFVHLFAALTQPLALQSRSLTLLYGIMKACPGQGGPPASFVIGGLFNTCKCSFFLLYYMNFNHLKVSDNVGDLAVALLLLF